MIDHSDPAEERAYSKALARLVEHVGPCPDCAARVRASACTGCGRHAENFSMVGWSNYAPSERLCGECTDAKLGRVMRLRMPDDPNPPPPEPPPAAPVLDLSDPATPLCPEGESRRSAALAARAATPAERLISFYALEPDRIPPLVIEEAKAKAEETITKHGIRERTIPCWKCGERLITHFNDDEVIPEDQAIPWGRGLCSTCFDEAEERVIPPADAHDCSRFAAWLREDPGRARVVMERLVSRAGPLDEREEDQSTLRAAGLAGFRQVSPSRGPAPTEDQKARRAAAAARIVALIAERYEHRHGAPPPPEALDEFRRAHDLWVEGSGDLEAMASAAERFREGHARRWKLKAMLRPRDPLAEMKKIARWISEELIKEESEKG